jgi:cell wall-associated NlpC family hydrolase
MGPIQLNVRTEALRSSRIAFWALALAAGSAACASTGATPKPFPMPGSPVARSTPPPDAAPLPPPAAAPVTPPPDAPASGTAAAAPGPLDGYALAGTALALRGTPYRNGGSDPAGFDCSGFTQYVFAQYGVALPRGVRDQFQVGKTVRPEDLAPGDIVFFSTTDPGPSHVAIVIGGDEFVHAPSSTGVVRVEHLSAGYWARRYIGARRIKN